MSDDLIRPALGIRRRIVDDVMAGSLPFGARVTIDELAERYGSSHMPVREALRELHGQGLVIIERNRGARIRPIDRDFVDGLFDTRIALEVMLARRAAQRRPDELAASLDAMEEELERYIGQGDAAKVLETNSRFHDAIYASAQNPEAMELVSRYWVLIRALWHRYGYGAERFAAVAQDHRYLIRALRERDTDAAAAITGAHVAKAKYELLTRMAKAGDGHRAAA